MGISKYVPPLECLACSDRGRLYQELGSGTRIALAKLAIEKIETCGRPFRLAIGKLRQFDINEGSKT